MPKDQQREQALEALLRKALTYLERCQCHEAKFFVLTLRKALNP